MKLKNCPFCGGEAEFDEGRVHCLVYCTKCKARTPCVIRGFYRQYNGEKNKLFSPEEMKAEVARIWNTRIEKECAPDEVRCVARGLRVLARVLDNLVYKEQLRNDNEKVVLSNEG